ncbi:hypothetical protein [Saccharothrix sp. NRRL B-16348]|nr:hypothetical protein [Saccharothrix sp. NRRL B-16348]
MDREPALAGRLGRALLQAGLDVELLGVAGLAVVVATQRDDHGPSPPRDS